MVDRFSDHDRSRRLREKQSGCSLRPMFLGHFACRRCIPTLLLAFGLWEKLSDRNAGFVSSLVAELRTNCPEVCVRRWLAIWPFLAICCPAVSGVLPRQTFHADKNLLFAARDEDPSSGHFVRTQARWPVHSLGARHNSGHVSLCSRSSWRSPNGSIAVCWAAFWCVYVVCQM